ncbi:MAG: DUF3307 domain-containing protein [Chitinophagaceae bacterium]
MENYFTYGEAGILIKLLIAHCIVDFFLQSKTGIEQKKKDLLRSPYLWWHISLIMIISWLFIANISFWKQILLIGGTHAIIDVLKIRIAKKYEAKNNRANLWLFVGDQLLHIIIIFIAWLWIINGWQKILFLFEDIGNSYRLMVYILAYAIVAGPTSYLVRFLTDKWATELEKTEVGLKNAGFWIGFLERVLIITFIFIEQYTAIGFLVAAKSILRLIDKPEPPRIPTRPMPSFNSRKHTEYVLIGTFISFIFALFVGLGVNWLLKTTPIP